ncbi:MAG: 3-isopropylmalate dehydratase small subunit [Acidimicrobiaceae bacterium]|nr:3-isopropylmalate dehydratase small subunit [Acidimicrobiaceae bacterium]
MKATRVVTGTAVPLDRSDVDTDQIIPSDWLKQVSRTGFEKGLFSEWRDDRDFVLNDERYAGATILVAGTNFGTGSSREHAVWAIQQYGFEAVISPRFADIFRNNCTKNGLVPAQIQADAAAELMAAVQADPDLEITVDVQRRQVEAPAIGFEAAFPLEASTQQRFLEGLDDIGITLRHTEAIDGYERRRFPWLPAAT